MNYVIKHNKTKISLLLIASLIFILVGAYAIYESNTNTDEGLFHFGLGIVCILIFSVASIFFINKLLSGKPAVVINKDGIYDNSSASSVGLINWEDIVRTEIRRTSQTSYIAIYVKDPKKYTSKNKNWFKKRLLNSNQKLCKTPITIATNTLNSSAEELNEIINTEIQKILN